MRCKCSAVAASAAAAKAVARSVPGAVRTVAMRESATPAETSAAVAASIDSAGPATTTRQVGCAWASHEVAALESSCGSRFASTRSTRGRGSDPVDDAVNPWHGENWTSASTPLRFRWSAIAPGCARYAYGLASPPAVDMLWARQW